ncbi:MAG: ferredoxin [Lachnospiraceae bacterium]|nr:ferredoxin [Lachnospiraceae bacterium]
MKLSVDEVKVLYAFGCTDRKLTVERLCIVAALATGQEAKSLIYHLAMKLSEEGAERWHSYLLNRIRMEMKKRALDRNGHFVHLRCDCAGQFLEAKN